MAQVNFNFNGKKTIIQCQKDEKMIDIFKRFNTKTNTDINSVYFLYGGNSIINTDLKFSEIANDNDKLENSMNIVVNEKDSEIATKTYAKSKEVICPECNETTKIIFEDYKILFKCRNRHKSDYYFFDEYEKTQNIDISKILCEVCKHSNKSETYNNMFFRCITCKINLCPLCRSKHDKSHYLINYEDKSYMCELHNQNFNSFCKDCKTNNCIYCEKEHNKHNLFLFGINIPRKGDLEKKKDELKNKIDILKNNIEDIKNILDKTFENMKHFYKIYTSIIDYYDLKKINYQIIYNINKGIINNKIIDDLTNIVNDNNICNKFKNILNIYDKISTKDPDQVTLYYNVKLKSKGTNRLLFGSKFVEKNKDKCKLVIEGKEYELLEKFNVKKLTKKKENFKVILKGIKKITDMSYMFSYCYGLSSLSDVSKWNTSNVTNMYCLFYFCNRIESLPDISKWNTSNVKDMSYMFGSCSKLKSLPDISNWDTSNVNNMSYMFEFCEALISLPDISKWNTSNVTNMSKMFYSCSSLKSLTDITKWNIDNVVNLEQMFQSCNSLNSIPNLSIKKE